MARTKKKEVASEDALKADEGVVIPRIPMSETGFLALRTSNRQIVEESVRAFRWPQFIKTVAECRSNPTVAAAMNVYRIMISRVSWDVEAPVGATPKEIERTNILRTMMTDMTHSWREFIESIVPYLEYGFGVNEVVLRRRLPRNGSKYSDGVVGIKSLPTRNQESICGWIFDESGANLKALEQSLAYVENGTRYLNRTNDQGKIELPREKILLFTASKNKGNPLGNSLYKGIFLAHKRLELLIEQELLGVAKDIQGILKIEIPAKYLSSDATPDEKAVADSFKSIIDNYNNGTQRGLLVPNVYDIEAKQPLFKYELLESKGSSKYDTEAIIKRFQNDILQALNVDILKLGADGTGSYSLADSKTSILALAIDYRLREIQDVLNTELIPGVYRANGWSCDNLPSFKYEKIEEVDLETYSKAIQRIFSTSAIEVDRQVLNSVRDALDIPLKPEDAPVDTENLPANLAGNSSKSGAGMEIGTTGRGTAKDALSGSENDSDNNADNKG